MKTKAKLTLAISALSAVVLAAGITSSYAWLTTQSTATFTSGTLTVETPSDIKISVKKLAFTVSATENYSTPDTTFAPTPGEEQKMGVVSSVDGVTFYAPANLDANAATYTTKTDGSMTNMSEVMTSQNWAAGNTNQYVGYIRYEIVVTAAAETTARTLYTNISVDYGSVNAVRDSYRAVFYNANDAQHNVYGYVDGDGVGTKKTGSGIYTTAGSKIDSKEIDVYELPAGDVSTSITTAAALTQTYYFALWFEGTDSNATNAAIGGQSISAQIDFKLVK